MSLTLASRYPLSLSVAVAILITLDQSFAYELSLMTTLSHPNIVKLIGFVDDIQKWQAQMILSWEGNGNVRDFLQSGEWDIPERVSLVSITSVAMRSAPHT